jgi:thiamine-phosphate pyrophosphorylase
VFDVYLITPAQSATELLARSAAALVDVPPGRVGLQLRAKHLPTSELIDLARALRALTHKRGVALLINTDIELARTVGADGVQLPESGRSVDRARAALGSAALIGASRHDAIGLQAAAQSGASFATLSPVFSVADKGEPLGVSGFFEVIRTTTLPIFALGGIDALRAGELIEAGAHGVAIVRAVFDAARPADAVHALLEQVTRARAKRAVDRVVAT